MIKKEIYPKTKRVKCSGLSVEITEKLDGSNLCIFKKDDVLYVAQRKTILSFDELEENKDVMYKGLYQWLIDNKDELNQIRNDAVVCGEWLGMGRLKYTVDEFDKRFYMFAKANIDAEFNLYNIYYTHDLFIYPFENLEVPKCIGVVPMAYNIEYLPDKDKLDVLYARYVEKVGRDVEGFVVNVNNTITKYVRMKNGKLQEHFDRGE
jgi:hypothetical protein